MSPPISPTELTDFAKAEAFRQGFTLVGVTTPEPPDHLDVYRDWIQAGRHGEMAYLETDRALARRANPRSLLPECQSILVVATNYLPKSHGASGVARYAMGDDYHDVLVERLQRLIASMEVRVGAPFPHRIYTDTGPVLERELAQRAGLGWIGKNTCLIHPRHGSYLFLAEVLLGLELVTDPPMLSDHCGSCTLCIEACPTQCILPNRTLDSERCISYLTIELRGSVPESLRPELGGWVFGCDICQEVCPWNMRFAEPTHDPAFQPRPILAHADNQAFLQLSADSYREHFRGSPLKRAKHQGLLRNAAVNAGLEGDEAAIDELARILLKEPHPLPRAHAAWALGQLGTTGALHAAKSTEQDPEVLREIEAALQTAGS
jgi:epoxyqueuosine reductase